MTAKKKLKVATTSLAGCFGCHMSFLDIDERLFTLLDHIEFDRSPLTDIKQVGHCDIGLIEGGLCNAENVTVLREFRAHCKTLVAVGACAITVASRFSTLQPRAVASPATWRSTMSPLSCPAVSLISLKRSRST